jgi:tetratricopeptide (TPR) repeat protein
MEHREGEEGIREFERAKRFLLAEDTVSALACLEKALRLEDNPAWYSYLGYCTAKERGQVAKGIELCLASLEAGPDVPDHYLNLAKIHLVSGNKSESLRVLREGMSRGGSEEILAMLHRFGARNPPVFPFLARSNPLNRYIGLFLSRIGLR